MNPIEIPQDWDDRGLITFEEFCELSRTPQHTFRDWRQRGIGPRWARFNGCGRLYITVAEARRFSAPRHRHDSRSGSMTEKSLPVYLSLEQAAEVMSLLAKTIRRRITDGTVPAYHCGRLPIHIRLDELEPHCTASPRPGGERRGGPRRCGRRGQPGGQLCTGR